MDSGAHADNDLHGCTVPYTNFSGNFHSYGVWQLRADARRYATSIASVIGSGDTHGTA